jgi:hypothetical protein
MFLETSALDAERLAKAQTLNPQTKAQTLKHKPKAQTLKHKAQTLNPQTPKPSNPLKS